MKRPPSTRLRTYRDCYWYDVITSNPLTQSRTLISQFYANPPTLTPDPTPYLVPAPCNSSPSTPSMPTPPTGGRPTPTVPSEWFCQKNGKPPPPNLHPTTNPIAVNSLNRNKTQPRGLPHNQQILQQCQGTSPAELPSKRWWLVVQSQITLIQTVQLPKYRTFACVDRRGASVLWGLSGVEKMRDDHCAPFWWGIHQNAWRQGCIFSLVA